jgi:hypothetical protein
MPKYPKGSKEAQKFMAEIREKRKKKTTEAIKDLSDEKEKEQKEKIDVPPPIDKRDEKKDDMDSIKTLADAILEMQKDIDFILKEHKKMKGK